MDSNSLSTVIPKKLKLTDYELGNTLGTGKNIFLIY
jgi:hypothetical protein